MTDKQFIKSLIKKLIVEYKIISYSKLYSDFLDSITINQYHKFSILAVDLATVYNEALKELIDKNKINELNIKANDGNRLFYLDTNVKISFNGKIIGYEN